MGYNLWGHRVGHDLAKTENKTTRVRREKKQGTVHAPGLNTNKEVSKTPKPPLWPDLWTTPPLTPYKKPALLTSGSEQGNCYLFSLPTTVTGLLSICVD